jgi:hypothetical protein
VAVLGCQRRVSVRHRLQEADEIKIYKGRHIPKVGSPIVIIAIGRDGDYLMGECYILFGDKESCIVAERLRVLSMEFSWSDPSSSVSIDLNFLVDSMRERAESQINDRAFDAMRSYPEMSAAWDWLVLREGAVKDLVSAYLRGNYSEHMKQAAEKSRFSGLSKLFSRFDVLKNFSAEQVQLYTDENT